MRGENKSGRIGLAMVGAVIFVTFMVLLFFEMRDPPTHSGHIYFFGGAALFGILLVALVADGSFMTTGLNRLVDAVAPIIPWSKASKLRQSQAVAKVDGDDAN